MEICFLVYILKINEREFGNRRYNMEIIGAVMWPCFFVSFFGIWATVTIWAMLWLLLAGRIDDDPTRRPGFSLNTTLRKRGGRERIP